MAKGYVDVEVYIGDLDVDDLIDHLESEGYVITPKSDAPKDPFDRLVDNSDPISLAKFHLTEEEITAALMEAVNNKRKSWGAHPYTQVQPSNIW